MDNRAERRQRRYEKKIWRDRPGRGRGRPRIHVPEASNRESTDHSERKCSHCGLGERATPLMRQGPEGPNSLCDTCGLKWSKQATVAAVQNIFDEESTEEVNAYEENANVQIKDLQTQLHLSDARVLKWQKVAEERSEKIKELHTEIECLNLKVKEITEGKAARHGPSESKWKVECQVQKEKNSELIRAMDRLYKESMSHMDLFTQVMQDAKCNQQTSHHQASRGTWNAGKNGHESTAEANVGVGDQNDGHHQVSKRTFNSGKNGYESAADVNAVEINGYPQVQTQHLSKDGSGSAPRVPANGGPDKNHHEPSKKSGDLGQNGFDSRIDVNVDIGGQSCEEDVCGKHETLGVPEQGGSYGHLKPSASPMENVPEALFTVAERKAALALVEQEFLMWLNSRIRRPTAKEMSSHKSQLTERPWPLGRDSFSWTGISGSLLLEKFHEETDMPKPTPTALTSLLRTVLRVEGVKWMTDMLWCLVWTDCMNPEQLPGYHLHDKRVRAADPEDANRSIKIRNS